VELIDEAIELAVRENAAEELLTACDALAYLAVDVGLRVDAGRLLATTDAYREQHGVLRVALEKRMVDEIRGAVGETLLTESQRARIVGGDIAAMGEAASHLARLLRAPPRAT
jgi:hypothetical protein